MDRLQDLIRIIEILVKSIPISEEIASSNDEKYSQEEKDHYRKINGEHREKLNKYTEELNRLINKEAGIC